MMHRCSNAQGNMVGPCSCGLFHSQSNSFSTLFSMPDHIPYEDSEMYSFTSSSASVDCTLSLGTPSTRLTEDDEKRRRSGSSVSKYTCWDVLQNQHSPSAPQTYKTSRGGNNASSSNSVNDSLLARRCANCDTTSTPLWRNGPRGPKSLCNACGIRFKKEERRATAAASTATSNGGSPGLMEPNHILGHHNNSWYAHSHTQKVPCFPPAAIGNEFRFIEENDGDSDTGIPFLSWRLNVTDRPSTLVHDFTR
ncbi:hypothetical protein I3843_01G036500 [Carya illinoinensis]|uniref:GATA-type domain-containing protein n=1 Tax=Carya illinoinensis TaxID=32201 RepID=A0A922K5L3_CARIL|nr:GATA transcription factor 18-like [Carya illinoinensis]KAG2724863.1 hypothetical protein I3760_01G038000 [Carya illinoinensis]KAG6729654.1 hypothetical protein I3842_01G040400 [Carya illinoinensis]KAG7994052.1 hypothetical protein I3843_01G036500 [Carya illinoinensis]